MSRTIHQGLIVAGNLATVASYQHYILYISIRLSAAATLAYIRQKESLAHPAKPHEGAHCLTFLTSCFLSSVEQEQSSHL